MSITYITGDLASLFEQGHLNIILPTMNCFHTMCSGVAKRVSA